MVVTHHGLIGQLALRHVVQVNNYVIEIVTILNLLMMALIVKGLEQRLKNALWKFYAQVGDQE
jgi:hypothetical protein